MFDDLEWHDQAGCKGLPSDMFFPQRGESTRAAKTICRACPVQDECLAYSVRLRLNIGIWGGTTERDRRHLRT